MKIHLNEIQFVVIGFRFVKCEIKTLYQVKNIANKKEEKLNVLQLSAKSGLSIRIQHFLCKHLCTNYIIYKYKDFTYSPENTVCLNLFLYLFQHIQMVGSPFVYVSTQTPQGKDNQYSSVMYVADLLLTLLSQAVYTIDCSHKQ